MIYPIFVFLAVLFTLFLFWRAARYELFSSQEALDLTVVSILGAGVFARIFDFIFKTAPSDWSISTFVFFNRYGGFDFWGALLGIAVALAVFERGKGQRLFGSFGCPFGFWADDCFSWKLFVRAVSYFWFVVPLLFPWVFFDFSGNKAALGQKAKCGVFLFFLPFLHFSFGDSHV